jgi:hypothetical protein
MINQFIRETKEEACIDHYHYLPLSIDIVYASNLLRSIVWCLGQVLI